MRRLFSDETRFQRMLDAEAALARAAGEAGRDPAGRGRHHHRQGKDGHSRSRGDARAYRDRRAAGRPAGRGSGQGVRRGSRAPRSLGATTQDIMDTGLVLRMRDAFALIERDLGQCVGLLAGLAVRHKDTVMTGRTHLQHAVPVTFGYKAAVWLAGLLDARDQLADMSAGSWWRNMAAPPEPCRQLQTGALKWPRLSRRSLVLLGFKTTDVLRPAASCRSCAERWPRLRPMSFCFPRPKWARLPNRRPQDAAARCRKNAIRS